MIVEAGAALAGMWSCRRLAHLAILRGRRAPRVAHALTHVHRGVAADRVRELRIGGAGGKALAGWLVSPCGATERPAPSVLVHRWGANAAMMWPVVPPLGRLRGR